MEKIVRQQWIDVAKGVAICAVILDHSYGVLYSDATFWKSTYFSVTVFVFLAGITSYYSCVRHSDESAGALGLRRMKQVFVPYAVAVAVYEVAMFGTWDLTTYVDYLVHFNIAAPFYFIVFYLQLVFISPYIVHLLKGRILMVLLLVIAGIVSALSIRYTFVLDVWGGREICTWRQLFAHICYGNAMCCVSGI